MSFLLRVYNYNHVDKNFHNYDIKQVRDEFICCSYFNWASIFFLEITVMKIANCVDIVVYAMVNMTLLINLILVTKRTRN
jgi:hypothetical protein